MNELKALEYWATIQLKNRLSHRSNFKRIASRAETKNIHEYKLKAEPAHSRKILSAEPKILLCFDERVNT